MNRPFLLLVICIALIGCSPTPAPTSAPTTPVVNPTASATSTAMSEADRVLVGKAADFLARWRVEPSLSAEPQVTSKDRAEGVSLAIPTRTVTLAVSSGSASHVSFDEAGRIVGIDGGVNDASKAKPIGREAALARFDEIVRSAGWDPTGWSLEVRLDPEVASASGRTLPIYLIAVVRESAGHPVFSDSEPFAFGGEQGSVLLGPDGTLYAFSLTMLPLAPAPATLIGDAKARKALVEGIGSPAADETTDGPRLGYVLPNLAGDDDKPRFPAELRLAYCIRYVAMTKNWIGACVDAGNGEPLAQGDGKF